MSQLRICTQKLAEKDQKRLDTICRGQCPSNSQKLRAAFLLQYIWPKDSKIRIGFLENGNNVPRTSSSRLKSLNPKAKLDPLQEQIENENPSTINMVKMIIQKRVIPMVGLDIAFVDNPMEANIRISFDINGGAWCYVGTQCLEIPKNKPTMNLGWLDVPTIIHEMLHACSAIHEHQNPLGKPIPWNKEKVYEWAAKTQGWDQSTTNTNILDTYSADSINGSNFDPKSIMLYFFPGSLTTDGTGTEQNLRLSKDDVLWASNIYPKKGFSASAFYSNIYGEIIDTNEPHKKNRLFIIIPIMILVFGILFFYLYRRKNCKQRH